MTPFNIDREAQVVYVRSTFRNGRIKTPKTKASVRAVALQAIALAVLDELPPNPHCPLLFPSVRRRLSRPGQLPQPQRETRAAGIEPLRRVYDVRHTFATFALRAGISIFDLSRYMGTSLAMIDRHRPSRSRRPRARNQAARHLQSRRTARRPRGGRWVDVERTCPRPQ